MSGIERTTRICSVNQLNPGLLRALREYWKTHNPGDLTSEAVRCCETTTDRQNMSRLAAWFDGNPDTVEHLGLILTAQGLYWARAGNRSGTMVWWADRKAINVRSYTAWFSKESGLELNGLIGGEKGKTQYVNGRLALGPEDAARTFVGEVVQAVAQARPPRKKWEIPWLKWWPKRENKEDRREK
jgi:hypothetical protein